MAIAELYDIYTTTCTGQPSAARTFYRVWNNSTWKLKIKFKDIGTHSKCSTCVHLGEWRRRARTDEDRARVHDARQIHVNRILLDRAVASRMDDVAARSLNCVDVDVATEHSAGALSFDDMDQAKFKVPRWGPVGRAKDFQALWRPQLHVHGVIVPGCLEGFFICNVTLERQALPSDKIILKVSRRD